MKLLTYVLLLNCTLFSNIAFSDGNWSAEQIVRVTSYADERASMQVKNYSDPNPSNAAWDCTGGWMYLGSATSPSPNGILSVALAALATQKPVRFGVYGSGSECFVTYITIIEE